MKELTLIPEDFSLVGINNPAEFFGEWSDTYSEGDHCPIGCALQRIYNDEDAKMESSRWGRIHGVLYGLHIYPEDVERCRLELLEGSYTASIPVYNLPEPDSFIHL